MADNNNIFKPGDVEITKVWLYSDDGNRNYDLIQQVVSIDIYESIMSPIIYADVFINDSNDLLRQFPILTEEYVEIEFKLPNSEDVSSYKLHVKEIKNVRANDQQKSKSYTLSLVSMELLDNVSTIIYKRYGGYKDKSGVAHGTEIHTAIQSILAEYLGTEKKFEYEQTKGIDEILITREKPFAAIDQLRRRALSKQYQSHSFMFFENKHGFVLSTMERLFDKGKDTIGDRTFWTDTNTANEVTQNMYRNIIGYKQIQSADSIGRISQGGLRTGVGKLDVMTGEYLITEYDDSKDQDKFKTVEGKSIGQNSSSFTRKHSKGTAKNLLMIGDGSRSETELPEKMASLQAYTQKITQNLVGIHIWGDNLITVGDVIECRLPSATGTTQTDHKEDRLSSGKFLVSKVRHILLNGQGKQKYTMSCELVKGTLFERQ
jgi:hypothetical protein